MEQQLELTGILRSGVYTLFKGERVVFVGRTKCLLAAIYGHWAAASGPKLPDWFPIRGVVFDKVSVIPAPYDRALLLASALVKFHKCRTNLNLPGIPNTPEILNIPPPPIPQIHRRI